MSSKRNSLFKRLLSHLLIIIMVISNINIGLGPVYAAEPETPPAVVDIVNSLKPEDFENAGGVSGHLDKILNFTVSKVNNTEVYESTVNVAWDVGAYSQSVQGWKYSVYAKSENESQFEVHPLKGGGLSTENMTDELHTVLDQNGANAPTFNKFETEVGGRQGIIYYTDPMDAGTEWELYVRADFDNGGTHLISDTEKVFVQSGIMGYSCVYEPGGEPTVEPDTIPDNTIDTTELYWQFTDDAGQAGWVSIAAVDYAGNVGAVLRKYYDPSIYNQNIALVVAPSLDISGFGAHRPAYPSSTNYISATWTSPDDTAWEYRLYRAEHSGTSVTHDDFKLINTQNSTTFQDFDAIDNAAPSKVAEVTSIVAHRDGNVTVEFTPAVDYGTTYEYYLKGIRLSDGTIGHSLKQAAEIKSGVAGYSVTIDKNPNTVPGHKYNTMSDSYKIEAYTNRYISPANLLESGQDYWVHIKAVDFRGNAGETLHFQFKYLPDGAEDGIIKVEYLDPALAGVLTYYIGNVVRVDISKESSSAHWGSQAKNKITTLNNGGNGDCLPITYNESGVTGFVERVHQSGNNYKFIMYDKYRNQLGTIEYKGNESKGTVITVTVTGDIDFILRWQEGGGNGNSNNGNGNNGKGNGNGGNTAGYAYCEINGRGIYTLQANAQINDMWLGVGGVDYNPNPIDPDDPDIEKPNPPVWPPVYPGDGDDLIVIPTNPDGGYGVTSEPNVEDFLDEDNDNWADLYSQPENLGNSDDSDEQKRPKFPRPKDSVGNELEEIDDLQWYNQILLDPLLFTSTCYEYDAYDRLGSPVSIDRYGVLKDRMGTPHWENMLNVDVSSLGSASTTTVPETDLEFKWWLSGKEVQTRRAWSDAGENGTLLAGEINAYNGRVPFADPETVTTQGWVNGAHQMTVEVTLTTNGVGLSSLTKTFGYKYPYHLYKVPKLEMGTNKGVDESGRGATFWYNGFDVYKAWAYYEANYTNPNPDLRYPWGYEVEDDLTTFKLDGSGNKIPKQARSPDDFTPQSGEQMLVSVITNKYVENMFMIWYDQDADRDGTTGGSWSRNLKENTNYISTNGDRQYTGILPIPDTLDYLEYTEDYMDGIYDGLVDFKVQITAQTSWGSEYTWYPDESMVPPGENNGYLTRFKTKQYDIKVQSIQLYDFHVTDITDRSTIFKTDVYVRNLPSSVQSSLVDDISETDNIAILKGYGFYFELWSRGLKKTGDHIVIEPKFYALKDLSGEIQKNADGSLVELTGYVKDSQQNYVDFTTAGTNTPEPLYWDSDRYISLGTHDRINIPIDLRTIKGSSQCWTGRYGVPADSQFFRKNANPLQDNPYSGYILVVFDVKAYRKSINQDGILQDREKYQYVLKRQWKRERELSPDKSILKSDFYTHEEDWRSEGYNYGTVAIFDSKRRLVDDYVVEPVWGQ